MLKRKSVTEAEVEKIRKSFTKSERNKVNNASCRNGMIFHRNIKSRETSEAIKLMDSKLNWDRLKYIER